MTKKQKNDSNETIESNVPEMPDDSVLSWHDFEVYVYDLPDATRFALMQRGFSHILGNEVAAKVTGWKKETDESGAPKYGDAELATMAHDARQAAIVRMIDGSLGVRVSGPRVVGIDRIMRDIAEEELVAIAAKKKVSLPKKAAELNALIDKRIANRGDAIRAEAERRMALTSDLADDEADALTL